MHAEAAWPENIPASHSAHESPDVADDALEYFPDSQLTHAPKFSVEYWPGSQISLEKDTIRIRRKQVTLRISEKQAMNILRGQT